VHHGVFSSYEFLLFLAVPVLLVWGYAAVQKNWFAKPFAFFSLPTLAAVTLIVGSVLGHDFFHKSFGPIPVTLDRILWAGMLGYLAFAIFVGRQKLATPNWVDVAVLSLLAVTTISALSHDIGFRGHRPLTRLLFFNVVPVGYYFIARHCDWKKQNLQKVFLIFAAFGVYLSLVGVAEVYEKTSLVWPRYISNSEFTEFLGRARGPFLNPVSNGMAILLAICSVLVFWNSNSFKQRLVVGLTATVLSAGAFLTLTRSVWLTIPCACFAFIWLPASRLAKGSMVAGTIGLGIVCLALTNGDFNSFKRDKHVTAAQMSESVSLRPLLATVAFDMFQDRPIAGHGLGQYTNAKTPYHFRSDTDQPLQKVLPYQQHNLFLSYLAEMGAAGVLALTILIMAVTHASFQLFRRNPIADISEHETTCDNRSEHPLAKQAGALTLVLMAGWLINGMFHDVSIVPAVGSFMFFIFGMTNQLYSTSRSQIAVSTKDAIAQS